MRFNANGRCVFTNFFEIFWRGNCCLEAEWPCHTRYATLSFWPVNQHFLFGWLIVGDGLERDVRNDASGLFPTSILFALIYETAYRSSRLIFKAVPIIRGG